MTAITTTGPQYGLAIRNPGQAWVQTYMSQAGNSAPQERYFSTSMEQATWTVNQQFSRQGDTATFYLFDQHNVGAQGFHIEPLAEILFVDNWVGQQTGNAADGIIFGGFISDPTWTYDSPNKVKWTLNCIDYTFLADQAIVFQTFLNTAGNDIAASMCNISGSGVGSGVGSFIFAAPVLSTFFSQYQTLSQALTSLIGLMATGVQWAWFIDYSINLHFFPYNQAHSTGITFSDALEVTDDLQLGGMDLTFSYIKKDGLFMYEWDASNLQNKYIVRGGTLATSQVQKFSGNGHTTQWNLSFNYSGSGASLSLNGQTISIDEITVAKPLASLTAGWGLQKQATGNWVLIATAAPSGIFTLTYSSSQSIVAQYIDPNGSVNYYRTLGLPNNGIFTGYKYDSTITSLAEAFARAQSQVTEFQWPQERVTLTSPENWPGVIQAGDIFEFTTQYIPDSQNHWAVGFSSPFIVIQNIVSGAAGTSVGSDGGKGSWRTYQVCGVRINLGGQA